MQYSKNYPKNPIANQYDNDTPMQIIYYIMIMSKIRKNYEISAKESIKQTEILILILMRNEKRKSRAKPLPKFSKTWLNHGKKAKKHIFTPGLNNWWVSSRWWLVVMKGDEGEIVLIPCLWALIH
jgi:hypothetical protein